MRRPDAPKPRPPTAAQLADATARLAAHGLQVLAMAGAQSFVVVNAGGLFRSVADRYEVVRMAGEIDAD